MAWVNTRRATDGSMRYLGMFRDPSGAQRSAGAFRQRAEALRAGHAAEAKVHDGSWVDRKAGQIRFADYVEQSWWPSLQHLELTTKAAYRSILDAHYLPHFGQFPMAAIRPTDVQGWVNTVARTGLSARSTRKHHTMLTSIFKAALRDRIVPYNPCLETTLPKVVTPPREIITPAQFEQLLAAIPSQHRVLLLVGIETGMRWGELAGLRPRHLDLERRLIVVQETMVEISKKNSPTSERFQVKPYPKNDKRRVITIGEELSKLLSSRICEFGMGPDDLLFPSTSRDLQQPTSRNTFRTKVWRPAVEAAGIPVGVRMHDLRHAHASWLLAGGADLKTVMDRLGHSQITTTQRYLHALPGADELALEAFLRIRNQRPSSPPHPEPRGIGGPSL